MACLFDLDTDFRNATRVAIDGSSKLPGYPGQTGTLGLAMLTREDLRRQTDDALHTSQIRAQRLQRAGQSNRPNTDIGRNSQAHAQSVQPDDEVLGGRWGE